MRAATLALSFVLVGGCTTAPKPSSTRLNVKGQAGRETLNLNLSVARTRAFDDGQLLRDSTEAVDFTVRTRVTAVDAEGRVTTEVTSLSKDGKTPLNELAYPEVGESIAYVTAADGTILHAGGHSPSSLYFIPGLPLPQGEVSIGDTWSFDHEWRSAQGGLPLRLEVTGILKDLVPCLKNQLCADVEISGRVNLLARPDRGGTRFDSRVRGRAVFSIERGEIRWSETRAREDFVAGAKRSVVDSCMISVAVEDPGTRKPACEPGDDVVISLPKGF